MSTLVIGGNGFVGAHLVDALGARGNDVQVFDRFRDGGARFSASNVTRFVGDFTNPEDVRHAVDGQETVVHSLSATTPASAARDDITKNLLPTLDLLDRCVATGVKRVTFVSSGGTVYGSSQSPVPEDAPLRPISSYGIGKISIERYLEQYHREHGLEYTVLRLSNPYGYAADGSLPKFGVIPALLRSATTDQKFTVLGNGNMIRDYIPVTAATEAIADLLALPAPLHRTYNVGSGLGHSVLDVLTYVEAAAGIAFERISTPQPASFVESIVLDIARLASEVDSVKSGVVPLDDGISEMWQKLDEARGK